MKKLEIPALFNHIPSLNRGGVTRRAVFMRSHTFPADHGMIENVLMTQSPHALLQGLQKKRRIINELIDGHMPLLEAAAQFQAAHQVSTACLERVTGIPTATDSESMCRTVIGWVHLVLIDRPEQAERVSQKLEIELQTYLQSSSNVLSRR